jgi:hypothetical protein
MTLPSNSSMNYYPDNTLANYVTKLPQLFDLSGEWEVGLSEIQFPISWYNVDEDECRMAIVSHGLQEYKDISPPVGHYENPEELVKQINTSIGEVEKKPSIRFTYNDISKKISIKFLDELKYSTSLKMTKSLAELLGFEWTVMREFTEGITNLDTDEQFAEDKAGMLEMTPLGRIIYTGSLVCDLQRGFHSLFVYCDIAEHVVVGDVKVPLLRTVNISGKEGVMMSKIYQTVQYVPIQRKQFDTIEIDIRDDTGRRVPFQRGKVIVTLHFRLKKPAYF